MAEAARLILDVLTRLGDGRLDVVETVAALQDAVTAGYADGVSVWVPSLAVGRLVPVVTGPTTESTVPESMHDAVLGLLEAERRGILQQPEIDRLAGLIPAGAASKRSAPTSVVFAPLTMPGREPGVCIFFRTGHLPDFTEHESDVLLAMTARCTPLIIAGVLSDHELFDRDLASALPEAVIAVDTDFKVLRWNPAAERLYGIPAEDAIGNPLATLYYTHYDDPDMSKDKAWEQLVRTNRWEGFVTQQSKAGRTVSVFASVTTVCDGRGRPVGAVAVNRDTTEIVKARSRVSLAENMLSDVLNAAETMTVILDHAGTIIAANREWLDVALATDVPMDMIRVGSDYVGPIRRAVAAGDHTAGSALDLLEAVLGGRQTSGSTEYRCDRPDGPHWYQMEVRQLGDGRAAVVSHREVTERHILKEELAHSRTHDSLTGLGNRAWLEQHVAATLADRPPASGDLGLIVCDIDGFAAVNEALGAASGDRALGVVADRLQRNCPPSLVVVRLGGDQFAVFADSMWGDVPLLDTAEALREAVSEPFEVDGHRLILSLSVGVAALLPRGDETAAEIASELVARADAARLESKAQGRNKVRHYRPDLRDRTTSLLLMRHDFVDALTNGNLEFHYQQIRTMADESIAGFEALVRWPRPGIPLLTPTTFGPLLEGPTIAGPLAAWTLETAAQATRVLRDTYPERGLLVGVNISAQQFLDLDVAARLVKSADAAGITPADLVVEVTETATFTDNRRLMDQLAGIHESGARIALDDFGTGFSSLDHLRSLPVDAVKVDRSFTAGVGTDPTAEALVRALIALAHDLGLAAVAEGVETTEQHTWLKKAGCDHYQGFLAHRPAPLSEILRTSATD